MKQQLIFGLPPLEEHLDNQDKEDYSCTSLSYIHRQYKEFFILSGHFLFVIADHLSCFFQD